MIVVHTADDSVEFGDATRVCTDAGDNLEIWIGVDADRLAHIFAKGYWRYVEVDYGSAS